MNRTPHKRVAAACAVAGIHALVFLALASQHVWIEPAQPLPINVSFIETAADQSDAPVPPPPVMEQAEVRVDIPVVSITIEEPQPEAVAAAVTPAPPAPVQQALVEARFDADYLNNPTPIYPQMSRRLREQGVVVLKVRVSPDGQSEAVFVYRSSGSSRLDGAALAAVKHWRFVPAKRGTQPVDSWVLVPIEFELDA